MYLLLIRYNVVEARRCVKPSSFLHSLPCLFSSVFLWMLGIEPRALDILDMLFASERYPQPLPIIFLKSQMNF